MAIPTTVDDGGYDDYDGESPENPADDPLSVDPHSAAEMENLADTIGGPLAEEEDEEPIAPEAPDIAGMDAAPDILNAHEAEVMANAAGHQAAAPPRGRYYVPPGQRTAGSRQQRRQAAQGDPPAKLADYARKQAEKAGVEDDLNLDGGILREDDDGERGGHAGDQALQKLLDADIKGRSSMTDMLLNHQRLLEEQWRRLEGDRL